ncbi:hypothetical protein BU24DRAFT_416283 [Aaosphaeria arxii CBS 175.79]|uniref:Mitochondrial inner-membrane-bound regulator-domain-containing protein n=1 Tax=Aaosphaeria arxii CBS 175.79 TaxID=1450172 RepID=A0A6A5Y4V3_9PLEO|nr:uncharacterized protein BU24DRAFT_416283 [Aaosphaeria arxii CBS 175.79]KAF2020615.1 hypothetical protein BU24DRAFT_416283 [Aaosphaeria arxii CBS 175.79]
MLHASRLSNAFVCIRCELNLARPRVSPFSRPAHSRLSSSVRPRDAFDDAFAQPAKPAEPEAPVETTEAETPRRREKLSERPLGKVRRRKGKTIRERTAQLDGIKALGKDARILVLREVEDKSRKADTQESNAAPDDGIVENSTDASKIMDALKAESIRVGQEDVNLQLEKLRPRTHSDPDEPHYVTLATFKELNKTLKKSFTVKQLSKYYSVMKGVQEGSVKKEVLRELKLVEDRRLNTLERTEWYPGTTSIKRRLPGRLAAAKGPQPRPIAKPLLIDQILRTIWNVVLLEEIEAPGEMELTLKPWQLSLLNIGEHSALDRIRNTRKAKVEIFSPHNVLRITADKSSAEYTTSDIEEVLSQVQSHKFDLSAYQWLLDEHATMANRKGGMSDLVSQEALEQISSLSGTVLRVIHDDAIVIRGMRSESIQEAVRLLVNMLPLKETYDYTLHTGHVNSKQVQQQLFPPMFNDSLDYRFRGSQMARYVYPVEAVSRRDHDNVHVGPSTAKESGIEPTTVRPPEDVSHSAVLKSLQSYVQQVPAIHRSEFKDIVSDGEATWAPVAETKISARYGQALFPNRSNIEDTDTMLASKSTFTNVVPSISTILSESDSAQPNPPILDYMFIPSPLQTNRLEDNQSYPRLHLRFRILGQPQLSSVNIIFNKICHDVLLPDQATDIRFDSYQRLRLRSPLKDPNIRDFAEIVTANISSGTRLTAPESLTLNIPNWVIPGQSRSDATSRQVEYMFSGIQHRQSLSLQYQGLPMGYSTSEGNKLSQNNGELSLSFYHFHPTTAQGTTVTNDASEQVQKFLNTAFAVSERITRAANAPQWLRKIAGDSLAAREMRPSSVQDVTAAAEIPEDQALKITEDVKKTEDVDKSEDMPVNSVQDRLL